MRCPYIRSIPVYQMGEKVSCLETHPYFQGCPYREVPHTHSIYTCIGGFWLDKCNLWGERDDVLCRKCLIERFHTHCTCIGGFWLDIWMDKCHLWVWKGRGITCCVENAHTRYILFQARRLFHPLGHWQLLAASGTHRLSVNPVHWTRLPGRGWAGVYIQEYNCRVCV